MTVRLIFTLIVGMGLATSATLVGAQGGPPPGGGGGFGGRQMDPKQMAKRDEERKARHLAILKKLHLSASQMKKIKEFDAHQDRQRRAMFKPKGPRPDPAAMRKMRDEREHVYSKVMTAKQYKQYQDEMKKERARMGGGRRGRGPGGPRGA